MGVYRPSYQALREPPVTNLSCGQRALSKASQASRIAACRSRCPAHPFKNARSLSLKSSHSGWSVGSRRSISSWRALAAASTIRSRESGLERQVISGVISISGAPASPSGETDGDLGDGSWYVMCTIPQIRTLPVGVAARSSVSSALHRLAACHCSALGDAGRHPQFVDMPSVGGSRLDDVLGS